MVATALDGALEAERGDVEQRAPDPFVTYVLGGEHRQRLRRAADEREARRTLRRALSHRIIGTVGS